VRARAKSGPSVSPPVSSGDRRFLPLQSTFAALDSTQKFGECLGPTEVSACEEKEIANAVTSNTDGSGRSRGPALAGQ
jgi:hypothetical protein